jgi:hypothetical protein
MSSQPGGGPAIPAAAALSGLASDEDQDTATPADDDKDDDRFVTAGMQAPTTDEDGTPVGKADAEADRERASDASDS